MHLHLSASVRRGAAAAPLAQVAIAGVADSHRVAGLAQPPPPAADVLAAALLHGLAIDLIAAHPSWRTTWEESREEVAAGLDRFISSYPPSPPSKELVALELLLYSVERTNPALRHLETLVADASLGEDPRFIAAAGRLRSGAAVPAPRGAGGGSLLELLEAPIRAHPRALVDQLRSALELWAPWIGDRRGALGHPLGYIADLQREAWPRHGLGGRRGASGLGSADDVVRYAADRAWMSELVVIAKNAPVWLAQLSRRLGTHIGRLDQIPDSEMELLASLGVSGIWLIGLWRRSHASMEIKQRRGAGAAASAYAIDDYDVSPELGGWEAVERLAERASSHGIRLGADMVPNHTGIDGRWVMERPDLYLSLAESPFPGYRFTGPNLSAHPDIEIRIEDGYWDGTDAAVVFQRIDRRSGDVRYLYHGNDGTALPWNDTAQLDYLNPETRQVVGDAIAAVARAFPIVRFDAAMTLAKRHIQRLWHPPPGGGGAIPSRAGRGVDRAAFEQAMPDEFWREVTGRIEREAPDTLLLAEAFWLLEGYFVRSLGMHRVYNSAFMHMTATMDNAGLRKLIAETVSFDPTILGRYVNFMSNPDEEPAVIRFGSGDRYFAVCTLVATLPGLPMFGHGQMEGLAEQYGMEFVAPRHDEPPRQDVIERHLAEIAPLLHRRADFAGADDFRLYDFVGEGGVDEAVLAYSNRGPGGPSLVVVNHSDRPASGVIDESREHLRGGALVTTRVADALGLPTAGYVVATDLSARGGVRFGDSAAIRTSGWSMGLGPFERRVLADFRAAADPDIAAIAADAGDRLVPDLGYERWRRRLAPIHDEFERVVTLAIDGATTGRRLRDALSAYLDAVAAAGVELEAGAAVGEVATRLQSIDAAALIGRRLGGDVKAVVTDQRRGEAFAVAAAVPGAGRHDLELGRALEQLLADTSDAWAWARLLPALARHRDWARRVDRLDPGEAAAATLARFESEPDVAAAVRDAPLPSLVAAMLWVAWGAAPSHAARRRAVAVAAALIRRLEGKAQ